MREIELRTGTHQFVAIVEIPPFPDRGLPEVVVWGIRTFLISVVTDGDESRSIYTEVFAYMSLTPSPGLPVSPRPMKTALAVK
jgi:hypothetical protein